MSRPLLSRQAGRVVGLVAAFVLLAAVFPVRVGASSRGADVPSQTVLALIDTGINPYSPAFRDRTSLGRMHPSAYIPGYPRSAKALPISLDLPYDRALERDAKLWASVKPGQLYYVPGTRIAGAISLGPGGVHCPSATQLPFASQFVTDGNCTERTILDDNGHGTMTASRAAGLEHSLAPTARIVMIEGYHPRSVVWAADAGWIDVQSNSWGSLVPHPVTGLIPDRAFGIAAAFDHAASRTLTLAASGNGAGFAFGAVPQPTYLSATVPPGVIAVGGHDNGRITAWAGAPAHVVADAYGGWRAPHDSAAAMRPHPISCCTSTSTPYAAGGAAAVIAEARRILDSGTTGIRNGIVATGRANRVRSGPLRDGVFTLDELRTVYVRTAEARPRAGRDDGLLHWNGEPRPPDHTEYGPGANPFCPLCTTMPVEWSSVPPEDVGAFAQIGYGAINERSVALAKRVLHGRTRMPDRSAEDAAYELDQQLRAAVYA